MNRQQRREAEREAAKAAVRMQRTFPALGNDETTPSHVTPEILVFCKDLDPTQTPVYVDVRPLRGAIPNDCFFNVEDEVNARGGTVQYGWIIWELPHIILNAEFHAVLTRNGEMVDITPKSDGEARILFLPDTLRRYERRVVPSIRRGLCPEGERYERILQQRDELQLKYERRPAVKGGFPFHPEDMSPSDYQRFEALVLSIQRTFGECVEISRRKRAGGSLKKL